MTGAIKHMERNHRATVLKSVLKRDTRKES